MTPPPVTIKIEVAYSRRRGGVDLALGDTLVSDRSLAKAKARLADTVRDTICHNSSGYVVACVDGTLLVGRTEVGGFTYAMTGRDRDTSWSCGCGVGVDAMMQAMERHACNCYGGVAWAKRV